MNILTYIFCIFSFSAMAGPNVSTKNEAKLGDFRLPTSKGNYVIDGSASMSRFHENSQSMGAQIGIEHFFWDQVSLGGSVGLYYQEFMDLNIHNDNIEKSVTHSLQLSLLSSYYFYESGKTSYFLSQGINYSESRSSSFKSFNSSLDTSLGFKYFLSPNIAFGPKLTANFGGPYGLTTNLSALFSIHF